MASTPYSWGLPIMQCPCGSHTRDAIVQRNKRIIGEFRRCTICGRMLWLWKELCWELAK